MIRTRLLVIAAIAILSLNGCSGSIRTMSDWLQSGPWWTSSQAPDLSNRARDLEAQGELRLALEHWELVRQIAVSPAEADREIGRLSQTIAHATGTHYNDGLKALRKGPRIDARNHFLAALRLDPTFYPALKQINAHFSAFPLAAYMSMPGDRPASIARKIFGDEKKAFLVTWFNDLPEEIVLTPGTVLILPKLKKTVPERMTPKRAPNRLAAARARLAADDLDGALAMATAADTADPEVKALIHTIRLEKASRLIASGQLDEGRQSLAMVPAGFAGKEVAEQALEDASKERQVAIDLATARNDFDQGRYRQCLERIEALLMVSPDNRQAADLETEARYRLALDHFDRQRYMDARGLLENANEEHEASAALRSSIDSRLAECAQIHYRNGVKHFINENLQSAITEWEKALDCNPQHAKARQNIENARRLLQKIESMP